MFLYLSIFILVILANLTPRKNHVFFLGIFCLFLVFFVGLRYQIGGDWYNYLFRYRLTQFTKSYWQTFTIAEPGYSFLNYYIKGKNPMAYINLICAIFLMFGIFIYCRKQPYPLFSLAIALPYMIFVNGMGYTRQATALGFILIALILFSEKKFIWYVVFVFFASMFHKTGLVFLALYPIKFINNRNVKKLIPLLVFGSVIFFFLISRLNSLFEAYGEDSNFSSGGGVYRHIMNAIPSVVFLLNLKYFQKELPKFFQIFFFLAVGSLFLFLVSFKLSTFSDRLGQFFAIVQISIWPIFINKFVKRDRVIVSLGILFFYFSFMIYWFMNSEFSKCCWINYKNYLFI